MIVTSQMIKPTCQKRRVLLHNITAFIPASKQTPFLLILRYSKTLSRFSDKIKKETELFNSKMILQ